MNNTYVTGAGSPPSPGASTSPGSTLPRPTSPAPGLKELAAFTSLRELDLTGTKVADTDLRALTPLRNLTTLRLANTAITDAGLKELAAFPIFRFST